VADLSLTLVAGLVTATAGLIVGWRVHTDAPRALAALCIALLFAYAAAWAGTCVGILARSAEAAQAIGLMAILPLSLTSSAFVSVNHMTPWLRDVAVWNPISVLAAACRQLLGDPNPAASIRTWPMQHPVIASAAWSAALIALLAPTAVWLYQRRAQR
jgi:ABC-type multidrug transport system permease subunit